MKVMIEFEKLEICKDDIGNLECNFCDRPCQKLNEIWWDSETEYTIISMCNECMEKRKLERHGLKEK